MQNKFEVTFPDNSVSTFRSANHIYTHVIGIRFQYGFNDKDGKFHIQFTEYGIGQKCRSLVNAQKALRTFTTKYAGQVREVWHSNSKSNKLARMSVAIYPVDHINAEQVDKAAKASTKATAHFVAAMKAELVSYDVVVQGNLWWCGSFDGKKFTIMRTTRGYEFTFVATAEASELVTLPKPLNTSYHGLETYAKVVAEMAQWGADFGRAIRDGEYTPSAK